jgi:acyl-CoA thioester hydrolase
MVFEHQVSLRWRDVDALGHVNHAVFLTYLEEGRDAFYVQVLGRDPHYVVARVEIDLRAEIGYADRQLRVRIEVERVGTTSLTTREAISARLWERRARITTACRSARRTGGRKTHRTRDHQAAITAQPKLPQPRSSQPP